MVCSVSSPAIPRDFIPLALAAEEKGKRACDAARARRADVMPAVGSWAHVNRTSPARLSPRVYHAHLISQYQRCALGPEDVGVEV
jgi:hypothetical protein